jgi:hypothetical protein
MIESQSKLIYKFASVNVFNLRNIILSELYFSSPEKLNDQFEGIIKISNPDFTPSKLSLNDYIQSNQLEWLYNENEVKRNGFSKFFLNSWRYSLRNRFGISCFSKTMFEPLMWSHYADNYKGFCLVFDKEELFEGLKELGYSTEFHEIDYKNIPTVSLFEEDDKFKFKSDHNLFKYKSSNWSYEKEVRIVMSLPWYHEFPNTTLNIYHSSLRSIIYGANMDEKDIDAIAYILRHNPEYSHVTENRCEIIYDRGALKIRID